MKLTSRQRNLEIQRPGEEVSKHDVIVTLLADLQQEQDKESEILMTLLPDKVRCYTLTKFMLNNSLSSVLSNSVYEDKFYLRGRLVKAGIALTLARCFSSWIFARPFISKFQKENSYIDPDKISEKISPSF